MNAAISSLDDPRVLEAVRAYQVALDAEQKPDRHAFTARFPDIADALAGCLDVLDFMHAAAPSLAADAAPPSSCDLQPELPLGDFRLVREIGRGGMGIVYEAVQFSLDRRVALKVLPFASTLDAKQLQRFKNEARAAAGLHHTNIVPVFATGCERGVHYYAMQFIEGRTLAQVIADLRTQDREGQREPGPGAMTPTPPVAASVTYHSISSPAFFRAVATLGVQAAIALDYAHQLGVVHRDIKPANLLVDATGNLWITDFGLAQCRNQAGLTMTGDLVGTLGYMSPEQASGDGVVIDQRSDIYSLGVTLYELVTLQRAFPGSNRQEVFKQVCTQDPLPPRRLNRALPVEFETILLRAISKRPEERYATARELMDDLQRFLDDRPIRAVRPSLSTRLVKWSRRHRPMVATAAVALLLAVAVLTLTTILLWERQQHAKEAHQAEIIQLEKKFQAQRIEQERTAANLYLVLGLLDEICHRLAQRRSPRDPQSQRENHEIFQKVLLLHRQSIGAAPSDPTVLAATARAYWRVGSLHFRLGEYSSAQTAYDQAVASLKQLVAQCPPALESRRDLARCHNCRAQLFWGEGRTEDAEQALREALEEQTRLVAYAPQDAGARLVLISLLQNQSVLFKGSGLLGEAQASLRKASGLLDNRAGLCADDPEYQRLLAFQQHDLGEVLAASGQSQDADQAYRRALGQFQDLVKCCPTNAEYRQTLASAYHNRGVLLENSKRLVESEQAHRMAVEHAQRLFNDFPGVPQYEKDLAGYQAHLAALLDCLGQHDAAVQGYQTALALLESLATDFPTQPDYQKELALCRNNYAGLLKASGRLAKAEDQYRAAVTLLDKVVRCVPHDPEYQSQLGRALTNLAGLLVERGQLGEAQIFYEGAICHQEEALRLNPRNPRYREWLDEARLALARIGRG